MKYHIQKNRYIYILIVLLALAKYFYFVLYGSYAEVPDSFSYNLFANQLITNNFDGFLGDRSPAYPYLMFLLDHNKTHVIYIQFIMGIVASVFWYKSLVKLNFSEKAAFLITLLFSFYLQNFFYETFILIETFALFLNSIIFYILINNYFERKNIFIEIILSFLLAILFLVKPFFIFYPFLIYALFLIKNFSIKKLISIKLVIFILPFISYYQWSSFVEKKVGYFEPTIYFGLNLAQNCLYFAEKGPKEYDFIMIPYVKYREEMIKNNEDAAMAIWRVWGGQHLGPNYTKFADATHLFGDYAKATIANNFGEYLYYMITNSWFDFWKVFDMKYYMSFENKNFESFVSIIHSIQIVLLLLIKFVFLILSFYYLYDFIKNRKINNVMILLAFIHAAAILQAVATYGTNSKYAFPYEFFILVVVLCFCKDKFNWFSNNQHISELA